MTMTKPPGEPMRGGQNIGGSRNRAFRCSDELWEAAKVKADSNGATVTDVLCGALADFVGGPIDPTPGYSPEVFTDRKTDDARR